MTASTFNRMVASSSLGQLINGRRSNGWLQRDGMAEFAQGTFRNNADRARDALRRNPDDDLLNVIGVGVDQAAGTVWAFGGASAAAQSACPLRGRGDRKSRRSTREPSVRRWHSRGA